MKATHTKLYDKLHRLLEEKYYILPRGPFIPDGANPSNIGTLTMAQLCAELEEFMRARIK